MTKEMRVKLNFPHWYITCFIDTILSIIYSWFLPSDIFCNLESI